MNQKHFAIGCWSLTVFLLAGYGAARASGLRINHTASLPVGVWRTVGNSAPIARGDVVIITPPDTADIHLLKTWGYAQGDWMKPVAAVPGDVVDVSPGQICVNGVPLARSAQLKADGAGHALPHVPAGSYVVAPGTVWLVSDYNALSLDSRYFGPVPVTAIGRAVVPVWIHQGPPSE